MRFPLAPGARIGILGGGQLGRMLALAGARLGFDMRVFTPEADSPAARVAAGAVEAPYDDEDALAAFAASVDVVTLEFENIPVDALRRLAALVPVRPGPRSLELTQDRLTEKEFIRRLGLSTAAFAPVDDLASLKSGLERIGGPAILKTRRLGYDGKGQARIDVLDQAASALASLGEGPAILEGLVAFEREASVVLARGEDGASVSFPVTENVHAQGILRTSKAPADVSDALARKAIEAAGAIAEALDHVGVLAVEFFVLPGDGLAVNEIAPRVHNSGHWTMDAAQPCQFELHIRAVAGWPLPAPIQLGAARMVNLIGDAATDWRDLIQQYPSRLHFYGKREARPGRKMGHVNTVFWD